MNAPLIFSHFHYQPYLSYTLAKARETNPDRRLIFLGDEQNRHVAVSQGWEHYFFRDYTDDLHARFIRSFRPVYGPGRDDYYKTRPDEKSWYLFWLKYVTERWFFIKSFIDTMEISRFWHFDSDTMILQDLSKAEALLQGIKFTKQCNGICLNGLMDADVVTDYCEHICRLYEDPDFIATQQRALDEAHSEGAFTEMAAFHNFAEGSPCRTAWLMHLSDDLVFDDCLSQDHGFETVKLEHGAAVKKIIFDKGVAYGRKDGRRVAFMTLNMSWLPTSLYRWVYAAQTQAAPAEIADHREVTMTVGVEFDRPAKPSTIRLNSYNDLRATAAAELRQRFRRTRRTLVSFASGFQFERQQKLMTASAAAAGEFHTIENWSYDRILDTEFYTENRDLLRQSRGQGYWLWKPYIIQQALLRSADGDLIVYNDAVPDAGNVLSTSILPMLAWLTASEKRFAISNNQSANSQWTKRDCFYFMNCDSAEYWSHPQVAATYFGFIASPSTRQLIADWVSYCRDPRILTDEPNVCGLGNFPEFQEHRHDQSVLSNLLLRQRFTTPVIRYGSEVKSKCMQEMISFFEKKFLESRLEGEDESISLGKSWTASSNSIWSPAEGVMTPDSDARDFFFHTDVQNDPWWIIDLGMVYQVSKIVIINRPNLPHGMRARRMRVFTGMDSQKMDLVFDATTSDWDPYSPLVLAMHGARCRYIKVALDTFETLHLKDVRIYGT